MSGMSTMPQNFYHSPIAYNGRTSSIILSGVDIPRPKGIYKNKNDLPELQSCAKLDYELEMGIFVSKPLPWGKTISADEALAEHVFGYALLNDWSARDIQGYESFPVGPFNAKSFATSLAPWVILPEALEPAKTAPLRQKDGDVLPHLQHKSLEGTIYDVAIECSLARKFSLCTRCSSNRTDIE
jgi:fumarylacetoacetase